MTSLPQEFIQILKFFVNCDYIFVGSAENTLVSSRRRAFGRLPGLFVCLFLLEVSFTVVYFHWGSCFFETNISVCVADYFLWCLSICFVSSHWFSV